MADIIGLMKFFKKNKINSDTSFTFTSADTDTSIYLYDNIRSTKVYSVGSDDLTPEVFIFEFGSAITVDNIFIDNHNIKSGKIEYWNGAAYVDFSTPIAWSNNSDTTNYYDFTQVSTLKLKLTMDTTMVVDAEKFVGELRFLEEIGTVETNPAEFNHDYVQTAATYSRANGGSTYISFGEKFMATILFSDASTNDMTLFRSLRDLNEEFYVYTCGGTSTSDQEGFRLRDMYLVNYVNNFKPELKNQILNIGTRIRMIVEEV
jgi:hypothetical protein